jgi:hypothetical protein
MCTGTIAVLVAMVLVVYALKTYRNPHRRPPIQIEGDPLISDDPVVGFAATKNASSLVTWVAPAPDSAAGGADSFHVFTDARGARVNARGDQTPARVQLLTIGCSFTWGDGLENKETYSELLKTRLGVSGANLAMASYSSLDALEVLKRNLDLRPSLIVYGFMSQHLKRNVRPCAPTPTRVCLPQAYVAFDATENAYAHPPRTEFGSVQALRYERGKMPPFLKEVWWQMEGDLLAVAHRGELEGRDDPRHQELAMEFVLRGMLEAANSVGARLVVVHIPTLGPEPPPKALLRALRGKDLTFVNLEPRYRDWLADRHHARNGLSLKDGHPNAAANELIADEIASAVRKVMTLH